MKENSIHDNPLSFGESVRSVSSGQDFCVDIGKDRTSSNFIATAQEGEDKSKSSTENFSRAYNDFKRRSAGVISEFKSKNVYLKPSEKRKDKAEKARRKRAKKAKRNSKFYM